ncbi:MAG: glycosyltransferase [Bdellovibrionota bacterium]
MQSITVLMPVRNGAHTLERALRSIHQQSLPCTECIVVDDGSTDATAEILRTWQLRWSALKALRTEGRGIARALNLALSQVKTSWIARMDADDRAHPERFERQLKLAQTEPNAALVSCRVNYLTEESDARPSTEGMRRHVEWANFARTHSELSYALWVDSPLPHPTWFVSHHAFSQVGGYCETRDLPEDYEWLHRFFTKSRVDSKLQAFKVAGDALVDWFDSSSRLTRTHSDSTYSEGAFNQVKVEALAQHIGLEQKVYLAGLGPKGKALLPLLQRVCNIVGLVDVSPRRQGTRYQGLPVFDVQTWKTRATVTTDSFTVFGVGTPSARATCEDLCAEIGLERQKSFVCF